MEKYLGIFAAVAIGTIAIYAYLKRKTYKIKLNEETIGTELKKEDVVAFFRSLSPNQVSDIPFIANGDCEEFRKMLHVPFPKGKENYQTIFIGVFNNKSNSIINNKLIHAKDIDDELKQLLGVEKLVVLQ